MFDIGFWELALIGVVALLVVGPERLPALARTVGIWVGRIRRYVTVVRDDIEREVRSEELKEMLEKSNDVGQLSEIVEETGSTIGQARAEIEQVGEDADRIASSDQQATEPPPEPDTSSDDEETSDVVDPGDAATTVGETVSARTSSQAGTSSESPDESLDESVTSSDERRSR